MHIFFSHSLLFFILACHAQEALEFDIKTVGVAAAQGPYRKTMEDAHAINITDDHAYFGVFDGHGGAEVAQFAAEHLYKNIDHKNITIDTIQTFKDAFNKTDQELPKNKAYATGSTAIIAYIVKNFITVANAGDSRAVLCTKYAGEFNAVPLSEDHKPDLKREQERIEKAGGTITPSNSLSVARVNGELAVSRALGDHYLRSFVIAEPDTTITKLKEEDQFLILACDGVWDVLSNEQAVTCVRAYFSDDEKGKNCQKAAKELVDYALEQGTRDNVTAMVINLDKFKENQ